MIQEIVKTPIGVLILKDEKVVDCRLFEKDPKKIAEKLRAETKEEKELRKKYPKAKEKQGRLALARYAEELGFCKAGELQRIISAVNEQLAKKGVSQGFGKDKLAINAVRAHKLLEEGTNEKSEVLREWYSIHFPELSDTIRDNTEYAKIVGGVGFRKDMRFEKLSQLISDKRYAKAIPQIADASIGGKIDEKDLEAIRTLASDIVESSQKKEVLREYIEKTVEEIAPNTAKIATPYVAGLLMEEAGSIEKLAKAPASTIQVLGAKKAMFRFLKTGKLPPKYGVLYVHPLVSQASKKNKGKMARSLASKISIAAKVDFYGGEPVGDRFQKDMEKRAESLKKTPK